MEIYKKIAEAMSDIGSIGKNSRNEQQHFMYRGVDAVMNALNPVLQKHGLFVVPEVLDQTREERQTVKGGTLLYSILKIRYTIFAQDGSNISAVVIGEGMDSGDKASNKAMSVAYKYAMFQIFSIPTEEIKDPDAETPDEIKIEHATAAQVATIKAVTNPIEQAALCQQAHVDKLEDLTKSRATNIIMQLNGKGRRCEVEE